MRTIVKHFDHQFTKYEIILHVLFQVLRKTFANFWRKQMTKSEMNHEIQARTPSACGSRRPSLTPLGQLLGRPPHQRRFSEVLLEPSGARFALSPHRPRILKRMATELSWRPTLLAAATSIDLNAKMRRSRSARDCIAEMRHGLSCNTLQVASVRYIKITHFLYCNTESNRIISDCSKNLNFYIEIFYFK